MELQNSEVFVGDRVFDISAKRGYGLVSRVSTEYFEVRFPKYSVRYDSRGFQLGLDWQTLFWHKPLIVQPEKDENAWNTKNKMVENFFQMVKDYKDYV